MVLVPMTAVERGDTVDDIDGLRRGRGGRPPHGPPARGANWTACTTTASGWSKGPAAKSKAGDAIVVTGAFRLTDGQAGPRLRVPAAGHCGSAIDDADHDDLAIFRLQTAGGLDALVATLLWGCFAYRAMPQRHDPIIPIRIATVVTIYPGADAEKVEQEVTRKIEKQVASAATWKRSVR